VSIIENRSQGDPVERFISVTNFEDVGLYRGVVLTCNHCGCLFVPMDDVDEFYPDRYTVVGSTGPPGCMEGCPCHEIPSAIDLTEAN
jgi:Rieske Fe-S protein